MKTNGTPRDANGAGGPPGSPVQHRSSAQDEAEWTAQRYVLGEMNADEAEGFERTLSTDLQACEQVAAAASLTADLYSALSTEVEVMTRAVPSAPAKEIPISAPVRSTRRGLWAVVGLVAAVCLLAAGGLSLLPLTGDNQEEAAVDHADTSAGSLVAIWTERSAETAAEAPLAGAAGPDRVNAEGVPSFADTDAADDSAADSALVAEDDYDVPGWMIAAVENGKSWRPDDSDTEIRGN
jgi:hypothetical protein